jgi:protein-S-isoprenylcysteine O-methyltransferase Ste14
MVLPASPIPRTTTGRTDSRGPDRLDSDLTRNGGIEAQTGPSSGARGGQWVLLQIIAGLAVVLVGAFGPRPRRALRLRRAVALGLGAFGIVTVIAARRDLGDAFSVFPRPVPGTPVAERGAYRLVRHPMYTGVVAQAAAVGIAGSPWALAPAGMLALVLDRKAAGEEALLGATHPAFAGYRTRTRWRFVPGLR